jgi:hypothetical protein
VILEKGQPVLGGVATAPNASQTPSHGSFGDDGAELQKLAVNLGSAPGRVLFRQASDQNTNLIADLRLAAPRPGSPTPVETKTGAVPADDGLGLDDDKDVGPAGPRLSQSGPEEPVQPIRTGTGPVPLENRDLLSEGENFEGGVAATAEERADGSED